MCCHVADPRVQRLLEPDHQLLDQVWDERCRSPQDRVSAPGGRRSWLSGHFWVPSRVCDCNWVAVADGYGGSWHGDGREQLRAVPHGGLHQGVSRGVRPDQRPVRLGIIPPATRARAWGVLLPLGRAPRRTTSAACPVDCRPVPRRSRACIPPRTRTTHTRSPSHGDVTCLAELRKAWLNAGTGRLRGTSHPPLTDGVLSLPGLQRSTRLTAEPHSARCLDVPAAHTAGITRVPRRLPAPTRPQHRAGRKVRSPARSRLS